MRSARCAAFVFAVPLVLCCCWGCGGEVATLRGCQGSEAVTAICGFQNPEDMVQLPGTSWLVISQFASPDGPGGSLLAFRVSDQHRRQLHPGAAGTPPVSAAAGAPRWGSVDCPGPPDPERFAPHGVDLSSRPGGGAVLAVVNHGGRESIEFFEVGRDEAGPTLTWRGCSVLPDEAWPNDVALLADGGVLVSNMLPSIDGGLTTLLAGVGMMLGRDTGSLLEWHDAGGWREIPGSQGSGPNGVAVSRDGSEIYFTEWGGRRLVRLRRDATGHETRTSVALPHRPDNISWTRDGSLLVTGQQGGLGEILGCNGVVDGTCAIGYSIVRVDPLSLETELVLEDRGAASVAVQVADEVYIGTFAGDRIAHAYYGR